MRVVASMLRTRRGTSEASLRGLMGKVGVVAIGAAWLVGCKVGPDYKAPEVAVPANWSAKHAGAPATQPTTAAVTQWWTTFNDPVLNELVDEAVRANLDLRIAAAIRWRDGLRRACRWYVDARWLAPQRFASV